MNQSEQIEKKLLSRKINAHNISVISTRRSAYFCFLTTFSDFLCSIVCSSTYIVLLNIFQVIVYLLYILMQYSFHIDMESFRNLRS